MAFVRKDCYCGLTHTGEEHEVDALIDLHKEAYGVDYAVNDEDPDDEDNENDNEE